MLRVRVYQPVVGPMTRMRTRNERDDEDEECGWEERLAVGVAIDGSWGPFVPCSMCFAIVLSALPFTLYIAFAQVAFSDVSCYLAFGYYTFRL